MVIKSGLFDECGENCAGCQNFECKVNQGEKLVLAKKKVVQKYIPPDVQVIKLLSQQREVNQDLSKMTDEELEKLESDVVAKIMENKGC